MPIMNGLEAVKQIRLLESEGTLTSRVPVIGVTANVRQQQIQTAIGAGMDDVVGKPFKVAELLVRMRDIVKDTAIDPDAFGLGITSGFEYESIS
jgi:CheY-like chemotaxis protein